MGATWDGTDYRAIDDDAAGDGTADTTRPLDTALEHAVRNNSRYLRKFDPTAAHSPDFGRGETDIKISSSHWSIFWAAHIPITRDITTLRIILQVEIGATDPQNENADSDYETDFRIRLFGGNDLRGIPADTVTGVSTLSANPDTRRDLEIDLSGSGKEGWGYLVLEMKSGIGSNTVDSGGIWEVHSDGRCFLNTQVSSSFKGGNFAVRVPSQEIDTDQPKAATGDNDLYAMAPITDLMGGDTGNNDVVSLFEIYPMSWIRPKSIMLEIDRDPDSVKIDQRGITHRIPYEAQWSSYRQARVVEELYARRRPGRQRGGWPISLGDNVATGKWDRIHWGTSDGTSASNTEVIKESAKIAGQSNSGDTPRIHLRFSYIGVQAISGYRPGLGDDALFEINRADAGEADLTMKVIVKQLAKGDAGWGSATFEVSSSVTQQIDLKPTDETGLFPILQQIRHLRLNDAGDAIADEEVNHEGQVYDHKFANDLGVLEFGSFTADVPIISPDFESLNFDLPVRVSVEVNLKNATKGVANDGFDESNLGFALIDSTMYWEPV